MKLTQLYIILMVVMLSSCSGGGVSLRHADTIPWSQRLAQSFIERHPGNVTYDSVSPSQKWNYEQGLMLVALYKLWLHTNDRRYFDFVKNNLDVYVDESGTIKTYKLSDYNKDNIGPGRALLGVYSETGQKKYKAAADTLRKQLQGQPRTNEGGYWHKKIYPYQMWLDGIFMAEPFHAWYAAMFNEQSAFDDIANQCIWIANHTRDEKTGLLYHAWDESKQQRWANSVTGCSPNFWGRAIGWYAMGLVDVLDYMPETHPKREGLLSILQQLSSALLRYQDTESHLWYLILDQGKREGNYLETSASAMFAYVFAHGVHKGYLNNEYAEAARQAFEAIVNTKITHDKNGLIDVHDIVDAVGLGGDPYRDGSYQYYTSVKKAVNDKRGVGALILAAIEIEQLSKQK